MTAVAGRLRLPQGVLHEGDWEKKGKATNFVIEQVAEVQLKATSQAIPRGS